MRRLFPMQSPLKLEGFNNLTKSLSFNLYDFCVARNEAERRSYVQYIAKRFHSKNVTDILKGISGIIDARVLAISDQDYDPWGASSMLLMSDSKGSGVAMHLDKSHICAHTYPDFRGHGQICSFRIDIDIATCGDISPLRALNYMFEAFESDVVVIDYVVRGYTRDAEGRRIYRDLEMRSIQEFIDPHILEDYHCIDLCLQSDNIWQTKMLRTRMDEASYFIDPHKVDLADPDHRVLLDMVKSEMRAVVYMWPD